MLPARKLHGVATTSDLTVQKLEADLSDDQVRALYADMESDAIYTVVVQRLSGRDRVNGAPRSYRCTLMTVTPPDTSSSSADSAMIGVTLSVIGVPTLAA
jgi:hypothetical protein